MREKYPPIHPLRYWVNLRILLLMGLEDFLEVIFGVRYSAKKQTILTELI